MPIYAFQCDACGHRFDRLQKLSDSDPTDCPECAEAAVRRQLTAPAFRLSGSGWYETDFKKDGDKKRNLAEGVGSSSETKSEAKSGAGGESSAASKPAESAPAPAKAPETKSAT
jgi:putative FmdB family regulatory protein